MRWVLLIVAAAPVWADSFEIRDINFDNYPGLDDRVTPPPLGLQGTIANTLYSNQGVTFTRDDGYPIPIVDWALDGRLTTSEPNVLATIAFDDVPDGIRVPTWSTNLNLLFSNPTYEVGAFFGNDQGPGAVNMMLSIYGADGDLLGSTLVDGNGNTSVDQFIGLASTVPFYKARFQNVGDPEYAVALDDVTFASTPEPGSVIFLGTVVIGLRLAMKRKFSTRRL